MQNSRSRSTPSAAQRPDTLHDARGPTAHRRSRAAGHREAALATRPRERARRSMGPEPLDSGRRTLLLGGDGGARRALVGWRVALSGSASLASRLGSVRRLCLNTTPGDVIDLDSVSAHARHVERFVSVEGEFSGGARFALATSLDLASTSPRFCALAQCPRVVAAFPTVRTLCTRVEDLETARLLAPVGGSSRSSSQRQRTSTERPFTPAANQSGSACSLRGEHERRRPERASPAHFHKSLRHSASLPSATRC